MQHSIIIKKDWIPKGKDKPPEQIYNVHNDHQNKFPIFSYKYYYPPPDGSLKVLIHSKECQLQSTTAAVKVQVSDEKL